MLGVKISKIPRKTEPNLNNFVKVSNLTNLNNLTNLTNLNNLNNTSLLDIPVTQQPTPETIPRATKNKRLRWYLDG